MADSGYQDRVF